MTGPADDHGDLNLVEALRTTGAVRDFEDRPVDRDTVARVLDIARFAPNGGNQQAWHVVLVEDRRLRAEIRDLYVEGWLEYLAMRADGVQPWAPVGDRDAEAAAIERAHEAQRDSATAPSPGDFAAHFDQVPVMAVIVTDLSMVAAMDRDLDRYTLVGGASIYPFVWSVLLAARSEGLGGVVTTVNVVREPALREMLHIPSGHAVCAVLALGYPVHQPTRLRRAPVDSFATIDTFDGPAVTNP